jgi:hypothetical protein
MSDLTIQVGRRSCALTGYAPARLYGLIVNDANLVKTRAAITRGVAGFEVELPADERDYFCERLRTVFSGLSVADTSGHDAQQILALVSAVQARSPLA